MSGLSKVFLWFHGEILVRYKWHGESNNVRIVGILEKWNNPKIYVCIMGILVRNFERTKLPIPKIPSMRCA